jgi:hypothetical protein
VTLEELLMVAAVHGFIAPFVIVGVGSVLGLTLAVSQVMLGLVLGMINLFHGKDDEE